MHTVPESAARTTPHHDAIVAIDRLCDTPGKEASRVHTLRCQIVRWVSDEPQPGWVEARIHDVHGREWVFFDKPPIFTSELVTAMTALPVDGQLRCELRGRNALANGRRSVLVTAIDCDAEDGTSDFEVDEASVERS
jgi:hypothetical protein